MTKDRGSETKYGRAWPDSSSGRCLRSRRQSVGTGTAGARRIRVPQFQPPGGRLVAGWTDREVSRAACYERSDAHLCSSAYSRLLGAQRGWRVICRHSDAESAPGGAQGGFCGIGGGGGRGWNGVEFTFCFGAPDCSRGGDRSGHSTCQATISCFPPHWPMPGALAGPSFPSSPEPKPHPAGAAASRMPAATRPRSGGVAAMLMPLLVRAGACQFTLFWPAPHASVWSRRAATRGEVLGQAHDVAGKLSCLQLSDLEPGAKRRQVILFQRLGSLLNELALQFGFGRVIRV